MMSCKKLLVSAMVLSGIMFSANAFAADLEASVEKNKHSKAYPEISKMIEYNNYSQADSAIKKLLAANPNNVDAQALETVSLAKQHKLAPAQTRLDKLLKEYPTNADLHYAQGLVYMMRQTSSDVDYIKQSKELTKNAIREFVEAVNLNNNHYEAYNAMGVATLKLGNRKDAKELFQVALQIKSDFAPAYDNLGNLAMMENNLDEAEKYFKESLKYNSHNPTSMYHLGQVEAKRKNYSEALTWINHSIHINPNSSPALNLQGELYLRQGNQAAAINSFKKAVAVKPENSRPYINLAGVYEKRADSEFAMEQLKTAIVINPNYKDGIFRVANMSLETKKYPQALDYYSRLLGDENYNDEAIIGLANTYYEMAKDTGDSEAYTTNKDVYLAYDYVNEAIKRTPNDLKLHLAKIKLSRITHQIPLSRESLNYIIQSASNSVMDSVIKGEAYLALGREKDAVYTFENALNFATDVQDYLYLAEILVHNKQFRTARVALQKALLKDPNNVIAKNGIDYINLCQIKSQEFFDVAQRQYKEKNYASTIEYCNRAIDFYHNSAEIAKLKAMAYEAEANYQGAVKYYNQYLSYAPNAADKAEITKKINKFRTKR
ncbi:MAG: tetratricopeptide repeat protein [Cyanobacteria bacterium SIG32]|nr:tetratricopeptide repeat protein [Cyanobacteria bacterium SIG32]